MQVELVTSSDLHSQQPVLRTKVIDNNGFNPVWNERVLFEADREEISFIVFKVFDQDKLGITLLCWNAVAVECLRTGLRVVAMKDKQLRTISSSLLCSFKIENI